MRKRKNIPFEAIYNSIDLLMIGIGTDGRILFFNPACEKVSGYRSEDVVGKHALQFDLSDEERDSAIAMLEEFRQGKPVGPTDYFMTTKQGGRRLISWCASTIDVGKGKPKIGLGVGVDVTERRRAQEALAVSEGFFRMLIENALDLVTVLGPDSRVVYIGPSIERLLGYEQQEMIGKNILDFIHPEDKEPAKKAIEHALARPGINRYAEVRLRHRDGSWRVHEASSFNLMDDPEVEGMVINSRDITERRRAERLSEVQRDLAIRLSGEIGLEETLKKSLRAALDITEMDAGGVYLADPETGGLDLACHEGLSGEFVSRVEHYEDDSAYARIVKAGEAVYTRYDELGLPDADLLGVKEGLRAFAVVPLKSEGRVVGSINVASHEFDELPGHARDALEILSPQIGQAIAHAALVSSLRESEENYRITFESTGTAMILLARDGTIIDGNQEIQKLFGYKWDEVIGKMKYMEFVHPEDKGLVRRYALRLLKEEYPGPARYEARTIRRDGRILNTIITVSVLPGIGKSVASLVDITDKKSYELELEARAAQLRDFLDIAAHELRHPATLMKGYAAALEEYGEDMKREDLLDSLSAINRGVDKFSDVVDDLLDVSRIERGPLSLHKRREGLANLIHAAVEEMASLAGSGRIEVELAEDLGEAVVDPAQFARLLVILLDNAVKYSPPETPIEVRAEKGGQDVTVSVLDRGAGIPEGQRQKVFERFFQAEEVLHHSSPGLGLGLYIGKRIVDAHGGRIWYEPREGGGSVFRFSIPIR